jgi:5-methylcytosine-specific restriction enzyme subunit McrC
LRVPEWSGATTTILRGFGDDAAARGLAARLTAESRRLSVVEHRDSIAVETYSYVGSVQIGSLRVVIEPKIEPETLIRLLRFGYGLPDLQLYEIQESSVAADQFAELIIGQLLAESRALILRGLRRSYREDRTSSASPKGRLDFQRLVASGGLRSSMLPVVEHRHSSDNPANRLLLAGLKRAQRLTTELQHRQEAARLCSTLEDEVVEVPLSSELLATFRRKRSRLFKPYDAVATLVEILMESLGTNPTGTEGGPNLPGFLFDMNKLWERVLERILVEHTPAPMSVRAQYGIKNMFRWEPGAQGRMDSVPRPDFALFLGGKCQALLDAKYRDLWTQSLPRDMLYQLAIYGLSQGVNAPAVMLYPSSAPAARDRSIQVNDPVTGNLMARIVLRPVPIRRLAQSIAETGSVGRDMRTRLAFECLTGDLAQASKKSNLTPA